MAVTFFSSGLTVSDEAAERADAFCIATMLEVYRSLNSDQDPPGWPNPIGHKNLIEWSIKWLFAKRVRNWEHEVAVANLGQPDPWEGAGR